MRIRCTGGARLTTDTLTQTDRSARPRALLLSGPSFALGLTFIALLIADEANALGG